MKALRRRPILQVADGYIVVGGVHRTATLKLDPDKPPPEVGETHQMLRTVLHDGEYERTQMPEVGDVIEERDDGKRYHVPRVRPAQ